MTEDSKREYPTNPPPTIDPTTLTTEALQREILALRELLTQRIATLKELLEEKIMGAKAVREQELTAVRAMFKLIENQRVEQKKDTKDAVDAALSAAKEAVKEQTTASEARTDKSEASMTKSIEQLGEKFDAAFEGQRREIGDLKERVASIDQQKQGAKDATTEHRASFQPFQVAIMVILGSGVVGILVAVLT